MFKLEWNSKWQIILCSVFQEKLMSDKWSTPEDKNEFVKKINLLHISFPSSYDTYFLKTPDKKDNLC